MFGAPKWLLPAPFCSISACQNQQWLSSSWQDLYLALSFSLPSVRESLLMLTFDPALTWMSLHAGLISDKSKSQWGRRRPMLLLSCLLSSMALLQLGFSRPIASLLVNEQASQAQLTIIVAVLAIFFIDFAVNAVNALARALLLDLVPTNEQSLANAWSARLAGGGSILGFLIGQADLTSIIPFRWFPSLSTSAKGQLDTTEAQLRCVCILVVIILLSTHAVTMLAAQEQPCGADPSQPVSSKGRTQETLNAFRETFKGLQSAVRNLSLPIWHIFRVQFFMWIAWFPICE